MNEQRFTGKGAIYAAARPGYAPALLETLAQRGYLSHAVADIGAGTGLFTRQLAAYAPGIAAVEPNDDMRAAARQTLAGLANVTIQAGTAEATGLPAQHFGLVTAAQAFHWFDRAAFRAECRRILRPGGAVALIWNSRDTEAPLSTGNDAVNRAHCLGYRGFSNGFSDDTETFSDFFAAPPEILRFRNDQHYDLDAFLGRNLSSSYAPLPGTPACDAYLEALRALFDRYCVDGQVAYPYVTRCYLGTV